MNIRINRLIYGYETIFLLSYSIIQMMGLLNQYSRLLICMALVSLALLAYQVYTLHERKQKLNKSLLTMQVILTVMIMTTAVMHR